MSALAGRMKSLPDPGPLRDVYDNRSPVLAKDKVWHHQQ